MADLIFYTQPQSRGRTSAGCSRRSASRTRPRSSITTTTMKRSRTSPINPMGKVPAIKHNGQGRDGMSPRSAAYLADVFPQAGLGPRADESADYYRWMFFAAGPVEAAIQNKAMGWEPTPERQRMFGYGNFDLAIATLEKALSRRDYLAATISPPPTSSRRASQVHAGVRPARAEADASSIIAAADRPARLRARQADRRAAHRRNASGAGRSQPER